MLTETILKSIIKKAEPTRGIADKDGLFFSLTKAGFASFNFRYQINGKRSVIAIGPYPTISLKEARQKVLLFRHQLANGIDPLMEKRKAEFQERNTLNAVFEHYFETIIESRYAHADRLKRLYEMNLQQPLGNRSIKEINGLEISDVLQRIKKGTRTKAPRPSIANKSLYLLKALFKHAVKLDLIRHNLALSFTAMDAGGEERPKDTYLNEKQIRQFFDIAEAAGTAFSRDNYLATCLLFCTATRKMELLGARWEEFDFDELLWTIPAERTKPRREFLVPLSPQVIVWLDELKIRACGSEYVFPARKQSRIPHVYHDTLNHAFKNLNLPFALAPHDIRRTTRTLLAKLGVSDQVAEICLNHKLPKMQHIYNKYSFLPEKREALLMLSKAFCKCLPNKEQ
jgi:integrase